MSNILQIWAFRPVSARLRFGLVGVPGGGEGRGI